MPNVTPPPVPTQVAVLAEGGLMSRAWIAWCTTLGKLYGYFQTIQSAGTPLPQELALNFSNQFIVADNPTNGSVDVSLPAASYAVQKGVAVVNPTGSDYASVDVVFPTAFAGPPVVLANPLNFPRGAQTPMSCQAVDVTAEGFSIKLSCSVPTGGGGATIDQAVSCCWVAIG
jgi:hypothetical protein